MTDLDTLVDRWVDLAAGQRQHGSHLEADGNRDRIRETLARQIALSEVRVARQDGRIVGFVSYTIEGSTFARSTTKGLIQNIYVVPELRGLGIGSQLLDVAEDALVAEGADVVALEVMAANEAARRFYMRHGYDAHRVTLEKPVESDTP
ncbi:GNAT family N-acetyltransferase [Halapricum salinum]|uniref:GNAT family N-acetyltransferase n=2 Tax=Halapricum salinum TaxID=1457250 RepID=A0A4D6HFW2_9EURY|nr:GNAT family N-acetyltransferase [Halapricum salinum]